MLKKQYAEIELLRLMYRGLVFQIDSQSVQFNGEKQRIDTIGIIRDDRKVALYTKQIKEDNKRPMYYATGNTLTLTEAEQRACAYQQRQLEQMPVHNSFGNSLENVLLKLHQA